MIPLTLDDLSRLKTAPEDLFLDRGLRILTRGSRLSDTVIRTLREAGITELCPVKSDDQDTFVFDCRNRAISLDDPVLKREGRLQQSLYDDRGRQVLKTGEMWTRELSQRMRQEKVRTLYLRRRDDQVAEDIRKANILRGLLKKATRELSNDPGDRAAEIVTRLKDDFPRATPRSLTPDGLEDLSATISSDVSPDRSNAFSDMLCRVDPSTIRDLESLETFRDFHETSVGQLHDLCQRLMSRRTGLGSEVSSIVKSMMTGFILDRDLQLNATLLHQEIPSDESFVVRQNLNRGIVTVSIAAEMGYSAQQIYELSFGAFLHDIGMLRVPRNILLKPGPLDEAEKSEVFKHPIHSLDLLQKLRDIPLTTPLIAYQCHERGDRSGYPKRKGIKVINKYARIVMVSDMYCALTSPRPHRDPVIPHQAVTVLISEARRDRLDMDVVKAFVRANGLYPVGSWVVLNDDHVGRVIAPNPKGIDRPVVRLFFKGARRLERLDTIDLNDHSDITIRKAFDGRRLKMDTLTGH